MRKNAYKTIAHSAVVFVLLVMFPGVLTGCGPKIYETYATQPESGAESVPDSGTVTAPRQQTDDADLSLSADVESNSTQEDLTESTLVEEKSSESAAQESVSPESVLQEEIQVYICGAVKRPGVYIFREGARIRDAVEAAGGLTEEADPAALNQAEYLEDAEQITVLTKEQTAGDVPSAVIYGGSAQGRSGNLSSSEDPAAGDALSGEEMSSGEQGEMAAVRRVNINTAGTAELMTLNGIGQAKAEAIISYREEHGDFSDIRDIMKVSGIKEALFEKIKDNITVS